MADTPNPGDRILIDMGNDRCDVEKITPAGDQVMVRADVPSHLAWQVAAAGAEENRGVVWYCHHTARTTFRRMTKDFPGDHPVWAQETRSVSQTLGAPRSLR